MFYDCRKVDELNRELSKYMSSSQTAVYPVSRQYHFKFEVDYLHEIFYSTSPQEAKRYQL